MKIKLDEPVLLKSDSETIMIAEHIGINHKTAEYQISYFGKVYGYDNFSFTDNGEEEWVYDTTLNIALREDTDHQNT